MDQRPFHELRDEGLLWLINTSVFHPRGYALALHLNDDGEATGWTLLGDGSEAWTFGSPILATFVKVHGHRRLVPTKYLDAWTTAVEDQERIQARRRERFASVQSRLRELSGVEFDGGPRVELSLLQAEALIEMLEAIDA